MRGNENGSKTSGRFPTGSSMNRQSSFKETQVPTPSQIGLPYPETFLEERFLGKGWDNTGPAGIHNLKRSTGKHLV